MHVKSFIAGALSTSVGTVLAYRFYLRYIEKDKAEQWTEVPPPRTNLARFAVTTENHQPQGTATIRGTTSHPRKPAT